MSHPTLVRLIKRVVWFAPTGRFRKNTGRALSHIEDTLRSIESQWETDQRLDLAKYSALYNAICFLLLLHYDFAVLAFDQAIEVDERKQNLYSRQLCILLHEAVEGLPEVFGASFRNALLSLPSGKEHLSNASKSLKGLGVFRKANFAYLRRVRNFVAAHRNHDVLKQLEVMRDIDAKSVVALSRNFVEFLTTLEAALTPVLGKMGDPKVIIRHVSARPNRRVQPDPPMRC